MDYVFSVDNLTKMYDNKVVVDNASFKIEKGSVCGLLGPNGAGKTTLMKMVMNLVKCDRGSVSVSESLKIRFLQDVPEFYDFYTVNEYLNFLLDIVNYSENKNIRINDVLTLLNLKDYEHVMIKKLSRGLRQKVAVAGVIIDNPDVLLLDEPVSALDPIGRKEMFDIIASLKGKTTIVFSSHILADVERICDHIILISKGKIILNNKISEIGLDKNALMIIFKNREDALLVKEKLDYESVFSESVENCLEVEGEDISKLQKDVFKVLSSSKVVINSISVKKENLETIFLREVKNNG